MMYFYLIWAKNSQNLNLWIHWKDFCDFAGCYSILAMSDWWDTNTGYKWEIIPQNWTQCLASLVIRFHLRNYLGNITMVWVNLWKSSHLAPVGHFTAIWIQNFASSFLRICSNFCKTLLVVRVPKLH